MSEYVLEARGIVKRFPGVRALGGVDFRVKPARCTRWWVKTARASRR
jgi:ABC-type sugar transport system ATPase subunit